MASPRESHSGASDSVHSLPRVFTSPHVHSRPSTSARRYLSESGIARELDITVSTIIDSEDIDVLGSDVAANGATTTIATTEDDRDTVVISEKQKEIKRIKQKIQEKTKFEKQEQWKNENKKKIK